MKGGWERGRSDKGTEEDARMGNGAQEQKEERSIIDDLERKRSER